jgi:Na+/H+ antiporter NhaA
MTTMMKPETIRPAFAFLYSAVLDRVFLKNEDLTSNLTFGISVGTGTLLGGLVGSSLVSSITTDTEIYSFSGKTVFQRVLETSVATGTSYGANRYVFSNDYSNFFDLKRLGVIALSQVLSEYSTDYMLGVQLSYLG